MVFFVVSKSCSSLKCMRFSLWWFLLLGSTSFRRVGFRNCGVWALECNLSRCTQASFFCSLWDLLRPRDRTSIFCISRQIIIHCTTREVQNLCFNDQRKDLPVTQIIALITCFNAYFRVFYTITHTSDRIMSGIWRVFILPLKCRIKRFPLIFRLWLKERRVEKKFDRPFISLLISLYYIFKAVTHLL